MFTITEAGLQARQAWLDRPHAEPTELRDLGLLQLFFADLAPPTARLRLAEQQRAIHRAKLLAYEEDARLERRPGVSGRGQRTVEHWRGVTLPMGLLYERAAVEFWEDVADKALGSDEPNGVAGTEAAARVGR